MEIGSTASVVSYSLGMWGSWTGYRTSAFMCYFYGIFYAIEIEQIFMYYVERDGLGIYVPLK
jgi:hypothetical protein